MISITLPDDSVREFESGSSGADIAAAIGPGLAKAALAIRLDGVLVDLATPVESDAAIEIVTARDPDALELLRHDAAHVMAEAVKELYPEIQITIGPNIEDGFFYDFARETPFTLDDLPLIEKRMHEIVKRNEPISREVWTRDGGGWKPLERFEPPRSVKEDRTPSLRDWRRPLLVGERDVVELLSKQMRGPSAWRKLRRRVGLR